MTRLWLTCQDGVRLLTEKYVAALSPFTTASALWGFSTTPIVCLLLIAARYSYIFSKPIMHTRHDAEWNIDLPITYILHALRYLKPRWILLIGRVRMCGGLLDKGCLDQYSSAALNIVLALTPASYRQRKISARNKTPSEMAAYDCTRLPHRQCLAGEIELFKTLKITPNL